MSLFYYYSQVNFALVIVVLGYFLLLRNQYHFNFNRAYLLSGILAAIVFPFIAIKGNVGFLPLTGESLSIYLLPEFVVNGNKTIGINYWSVFLGLYLSVTVSLLINLIYRIYQLFAELRKAVIIERIGNFDVIENLKGSSSFSFFQFIVIGNSYSAEEREQVIAHELVHARNLHSLDILLAEILKAFFWFNPAIYILKKLFTSIHEFQADKTAVKNCDANQYCNLLARVALQSADYPIANHFNNSLTFKRITMIKNANGRLQWWRVISSIAIIVGLFVFVSCKEESKLAEKISASDEVFAVVDESAAPVDGMTDFFEFISDHLTYPEQARKMGVEGKVFVQFIVNKDGSISDVTVVKGIGAGCDKAALEVISSSPKWRPGKQAGLIVRQRFTVPINFKLG